MNKNAPQTVQTIAAADNFADWLRTELKNNHISMTQLANAIGYERKAVISWAGGKTSPRLDAIALVFAYFGKNRIEIEINPRKEEE